VATEVYKDHLLIWNAEQDARSDKWRPYVIISWKAANGARQFHQIKGPLLIFPDEAFRLAKQLGEAWVDGKL
jgi:hypothetical protein